MPHKAQEDAVSEDKLVREYLTPELAEWCEGVLGRFGFVNWDRLIFNKTQNGPHVITCYGWIDREKDSYKDFVALHLVLDARKVLFSLSSSAEHNDRIAELCAEISGGTSIHKKCTRVEELFSVPNMIRREGNAGAAGEQKE